MYTAPYCYVERTKMFTYMTNDSAAVVCKMKYCQNLYGYVSF